MAAAQRLEPIYNELRELVKDSYYVMADETPHPVPVSYTHLLAFMHPAFSPFSTVNTLSHNK